MKLGLLVMLLICVVAFAIPESFRSLSTSGMLLDDIDLWVNGILSVQAVPDRVLEVEGYRVYTGLSNLADGSDMAFDESEEGEGGFLVGGSAPFEESAMAAGILAGFFDERVFEEIAILGPGGTPFVNGFGEAEGTWSEYTDTDSDGTYDTNHTVYQSAHGWCDSTRMDIGAAFGWSPKEDIQLGLAVGYFTESLLDESSDNNNHTIVSDTNLITGVPTYLSDIEGIGSEENSISGFSVAVSGRGMVTENMSLGGMFNFSPVSGDQSSSFTETGSNDWLPGQPDVHNDIVWNTTEDFSLDISGQRMGGGAVATWFLTENWTVDLAGGYYITGADGSSNTYLVQTDSLILVTTGSTTSISSFDITGGGTRGIDISDNLMIAAAKTTAEPFERMTVSFGLLFSNQDETVTENIVTDYNHVQTYDDGDDVVADPDDFTAVTTWSQNEEIRTTTETRTISLPVGLEVGVLPKVVARLGASPAFVWEDNVQTETMLDASPMTTHTVYGNGVETYTTENPWVNYNGSRVATEDKRTEIPFTYGLGFNPNEFLEIDLMGLGSNFSEWRVSATLSF